MYTHRTGAAAAPAPPPASTTKRVEPAAATTTPSTTTEGPCIVIDSTTNTKYLKGKFLGKGGFAKVYELKDLTTGVTYAGKVVAKSSLTKKRAKQKLLSEIKLHRSLNHQHIVRFERFFEDKDNVYIVLEMCANKSFMELVKTRRRLTEVEVAYYLLQLLSATEFMHSNNIIHRDLKLGNLFISDKCEVKVGDFGLATSLTHTGERKKTICGTPNYIAPEVLDSNGRGHSYEVDIWSIGCIVYTLLIGKPPFETADVKSTYKRIKDNVYSFPERVPISEAARTLIRAMLRSNPDERLSLTEIRQHRFLTGNRIPKKLPSTCMVSTPRMSELFNDEAPATGTTAPSASTTTTTTSTKDTDRAPLTDRNAYPERRVSSLNTRDIGAAVASAKASLPSSKPAVPGIDLETMPLPQIPTRAATDRSEREREREKEREAQREKERDRERAAEKEKRERADRLLERLERERLEREKSEREVAATREKLERLERERASQPEKGGIALDARAERVQLAIDRATRGREAAAAATQDRVADKLADRLGSVRLTEKDKVPAVPERSRKDKEKTTKEKEKEPEGTAPSAGADDMDEDDRGTLDTMHRRLTRSFAVLGAAAATADRDDMRDAAAVAAEPKQWVVKWVDYSNKYGLGYQLADGTIGVFFNDATKIILAPDAERVEYIERLRTDAGPVEDRSVHTMHSFPTTMQKKITLLKYFKNYLVEHLEQRGKEDGPAQGSPTAAGTIKESTSGAPGSVAAYNGSALTYVKKWMRTKHAIIFRLSDKTVQVNFFDHTKIILSSEAQLVTFVDKQRHTSHHTLQEIMRAPGHEIVNRLKYAKDILYHLLSKHSKAAPALAPDADPR